MLNSKQLVERFIASRRDGLASTTLSNYRLYLTRSSAVVSLNVTCVEIQDFLKTRPCSGGGKHAYYRCLRAFYNWLYSRKSGLGLNPQDNPILDVDAPVVENKILPSRTSEEVNTLIDAARCVRDKAIVSLFADSGLRLTELCDIDPANIDWQRRLIKVRCKGHKEGYAVFGERTESLLRQWLDEHANVDDRLWDINKNGVNSMLRQLQDDTGLKCNAHTFRRTFASILSKRNVDALHIMRLGRWSSIQMVQRYTKSVLFDDSLKLYSAVVA